jgi:uncharacterized membrane protein YuzA (DUF378 family)
MMAKLHILAIVLVLLGAMNTTAGLFETNPIMRLGNSTDRSVSTTLLVLIGLSTLYIFFNRSTYLPFLGETVFPCATLTKRTPKGANLNIMVKTKPNTKVVYWAAEPSANTERDPQKAYASYKNSGVAIADNNGKAVLSVRRPTGYNVPFKKLDSHVHYREGEMNMLGEVRTVVV